MNNQGYQIPFYLPDVASVSDGQFWPDASVSNVIPTSGTIRDIMMAGSRVGSACIDYVAPNLPQDIPDSNANRLISIISVPSGGTIIV